ncbi:hypothetical protein LPC08_07480 [Roseomonas sp. OT10]|uniref:hypothetical protein n=1 Tax=Roseomonas cutis TaxID=2897332 RepID=UPI001E489029|nr:hypothetical protein [Roseomonas sp. OT10]UFN50449.1 hypothetical protein LPC08_07480 [Roseomonas sp. OT10]
MRLVPLGFLLLLAAAPAAGRAPADFPPRPEALFALLDQAWRSLPPESRGRWQPLLSPPFPARWPPAGRGAVAYEAYAVRIEPGLVDAVRIARPWARVEAAPGGPPRLLPSGTPEPLGIQGVRPIRPDDATAPPADPRLATLLASLDALPPEGSEAALVLRRAYCGWRKFNGVIAAVLAEASATFFAWFACR